MRPVTAEMVIAGNGTLNTSVSQIVDARFLFSASLQAVIGGSSPVGTLTLEASNDITENLTENPPTHFSTVGTVAINATGVFMIPKFDICYRYIRAKFVYTSGTVLLTSINLNALGA